MKHLMRLFIFLLAAAIALTITAYITTATFWSAPTVVAAGRASNLAGGVATAVPDMLKSQLGLTADETFEVKYVATKDHLQPVVDTVLTQLATPPGDGLKLDLSSFKQTLEQASLPLTPGLTNLTDHPITLIAPAQTTRLASLRSAAERAKLLGPVAVAILALIVFALGRHRRFRALAAAFLLGGILTVAVGGLFLALPHVISSPLKTSPLAPVAPSIVATFTVLARSASHDAIYAAIALAVLAIALMLLHILLKITGRLKGHKGSHA